MGMLLFGKMYICLGVCSSENFNCETFAGTQSTGWVLGSGGYCCNPGNYIKNHCPLFGDGTKVTVHLDMNKRTCALWPMIQNIQKYQHGIIYCQSFVQWYHYVILVEFKFNLVKRYLFVNYRIKIFAPLLFFS
jgi:hypothetical protein